MGSRVWKMSATQMDPKMENKATTFSARPLNICIYYYRAIIIKKMAF